MALERWKTSIKNWMLLHLKLLDNGAFSMAVTASVDGLKAIQGYHLVALDE